jgi:hypothetical protein
MQGPSIELSDDDDSIIEVSASRPSAFQIPSRSSGPSGFMSPGFSSGNFNSSGADMLINKRKVSGDVLSMGSGSGSGSGSSIGSESDATGTETDDGDGGGGGGGWNGANRFGSSPAADASQRYQSEKARMETEHNEKREILFQMDRLESRGYQLPRRFTMESNIDDMRTEYHRVLREKELDASIRFQQKMMVAFVTGMEFLNTRFDPFDLRLDGWSENVHGSIEDYNDIFTELHDKYKGTGKKMAPELRLMLSLSGSAFMFHLTKSMFRQQPLPDVEAVLRSNPDLYKQFQSAAMNSHMDARRAAGTPQPPPPLPQQQQQPMGGGGIMGMIGNMFGGGMMGGGPQPFSQMPQQRQAPPPQPPQRMQQPHANISVQPPPQNQRMESMSMSDEEIVSIIEDVKDMAGISEVRSLGGPGSITSNGTAAVARQARARAAASGKRTLEL